MTGSMQTSARRTRWLAACAIAMGLGAGVVTGTGVALADTGTAPATDASPPPTNGSPGTVATALEQHGVAIPPQGFEQLEQIGSIVTSTLNAATNSTRTTQNTSFGTLVKSGTQTSAQALNAAFKAGADAQNNLAQALKARTSPTNTLKKFADLASQIQGNFK